MVFPKLPSFIRVPRYKTFSLTPRYYNPVQEEKEKRIARIKAEFERESFGKSADNQEHIRIKDFYRQRRAKGRMAMQKQSFARVLLILVALILIVYIIFK